MPYPNYPYVPFQPGFYNQPVPDQMAQFRQNQWTGQNPQQIPMQNQPVQPMQQQMQAIQPSSAQQSNGIIWVSKEEAYNWPIAPGDAAALWDRDNPVIYLRQADSTGKPSTKVYDLVERTDVQPTQKQAPQIDMSKYLTIEDAKEIIERCVNDILAERMKRPIKGAKMKEDTDNG